MHPIKKAARIAGADLFVDGNHRAFQSAFMFRIS